LNVKGIAFREGEAEVGAAEVDFIAIHNILARGIRGGAGEGLGINAVEHHDEDFLSFVVVAALPSVHVIG